MSHSFKLHEFVNLLMKNGVKFSHFNTANPYNRFEDNITCINLDDMSVDFTSDGEFLRIIRNGYTRTYQPQDVIDYLGLWDEVEKDILISKDGTFLTVGNGTPVSVIPDQIWEGEVPTHEDGLYSEGELVHFTGADGSTRVLVKALYVADIPGV